MVIGRCREASGRCGSSSWLATQPMPPRKMMTSNGTDQTRSSSFPEYAQSGRYLARVLDARNHQAKATVAMITGTTMPSMIASEFKSSVFSPAATGPAGSSVAGAQALPSASGSATMARRADRVSTRVWPDQERMLDRSLKADKSWLHALCPRDEGEPGAGLVARGLTPSRRGDAFELLVGRASISQTLTTVERAGRSARQEPPTGSCLRSTASAPLPWHRASRPAAISSRQGRDPKRRILIIAVAHTPPGHRWASSS